MPLLTVFSISLVAAAAFAFRPVSAMDEMEHFDYNLQIAHGKLVRPGDRITQEAMRTAACRTVDLASTPPCGLSSYSPQQFPGEGWNIEDQNAPLFYASNVPFALGLRIAHVANNDFDAFRLAGAAWLALGLVGLWEFALLLGASRLGSAAISISAASVLNVLMPSSTQTPDATALAAGAFVGIAVVQVQRRRWPPWFAFLIAAISALIYVHNALAVGAGALYLLISAATDRTQRRRLIFAALGLLASGMVGQGSWLVVRHMLNPSAVVPPALQSELVPQLAIRDVIEQIPYFLTPVRAPYVPGFLQHPSIEVMSDLQNMLFVVGSIGLALVGGRLVAARTAAWSGLGAALVGAPLIVVLTFVYRHSFVPAYPRYGLSLLPFMAAPLGVAISATRASLVVAAFGLGSCIMILFYGLTTIF